MRGLSVHIIDMVCCCLLVMLILLLLMQNSKLSKIEVSYEVNNIV